MDIINTSLINLHTQLQNNIIELKKQHQIAIINTSQHYFNLYSNFDNALKECFTEELNKLSTILPVNNIFCPMLIFEFDNNRNPINILHKDDLNVDIGYLQNRKIMYEIDLIYSTSAQSEDLNNLFQNIDVTSIINNYTKKTDYTFYNANISLNAQDTGFSHNNYRLKQKKINIELISSDKNIYKNFKTFKLKVDNYLNIEYCIDTEYFKDPTDLYKNRKINHDDKHIYFCFNKIPFPELAFTTNIKLNKVIIKKANNIIDVNTSNIYKNFSKKNNYSELEPSICFISDNYEEVYNYFNNFRKLSNWYNEQIIFNKQHNVTLEIEIVKYKQTIIDLETKLTKSNELVLNYKNLIT